MDLRIKLEGAQLAHRHKKLGNGWALIQEHHLEKDYLFPDFAKALIFTNQVGTLAEKEEHHPDIFLSYGRVKVQLWTHSVEGLSEADFTLAAKCDELPQ